MGDVISLEQYRRRLARRNQGVAKPKKAGTEKPRGKPSRPKGAARDKERLSLELPAGEPPDKKA